jgi:hypothetical protein
MHEGYCDCYWPNRSRREKAGWSRDIFSCNGGTPSHISLQDGDERIRLAATPFVFLRNRTSELPQEVCGGERRVRERFEQIRTLVINRDNGPENHSHWTQFLNRLVALVQTYHLTVTLAYYPPYHSKYHPVVRCWGG